MFKPALFLNETDKGIPTWDSRPIGAPRDRNHALAFEYHTYNWPIANFFLYKKSTDEKIEGTDFRYKDAPEWMQNFIAKEFA